MDMDDFSLPHIPLIDGISLFIHRIFTLEKPTLPYIIKGGGVGIQVRFAFLDFISIPLHFNTENIYLLSGKEWKGKG